MKKVIYDGETMREHYQSGYISSLTAFIFLRFVILCTVQVLHSYEYADGRVPLYFLVR